MPSGYARGLRSEAEPPEPPPTQQVVHYPISASLAVSITCPDLTPPTVQAAIGAVHAEVMISSATPTVQPAAVQTPAQAALTPGQAKAAYTARQRAAATAAGRATPRTTQPGLYLAGQVGVVLFSDAGRLMEIDFSLDPAQVAAGQVRTVGFGDSALALPPSRPASPVSFDRLSQIVRDAYEVECRTGARNESPTGIPGADDSHRVAVLADRATLTVMTRMADAAARGASTMVDKNEAALTRAISKTLAYRSALSHSGFLPVLTQALAQRFWAPAAIDDTSLLEWADLFGVGQATAPERFGRLLVATLDGPQNVKYVKSLLNSEKFGTLSSQYSGALSASKAFRNANAVQTAHAAIVATDPLLAEFNMLSGDVAKVRIVKGTEQTFTARVSDPFKMKAGSDVLLFDVDSEVGKTSEATLTAVDYTPGDDALLARFSKGKRHNKTWWLVKEATANHRPLYAVTVPFISGGQRVNITGRWLRSAQASEALGQEQPTRVGRQVPADVALAGAPEVM